MFVFAAARLPLFRSLYFSFPYSFFLFLSFCRSISLCFALSITHSLASAPRSCLSSTTNPLSTSSLSLSFSPSPFLSLSRPRLSAASGSGSRGGGSVRDGSGSGDDELLFRVSSPVLFFLLLHLLIFQGKKTQILYFLFLTINAHEHAHNRVCGGDGLVRGTMAHSRV